MNGQYYKNPRFPTLETEEEKVIIKEENIDIHDLSLFDLLLINKENKIKGFFLSSDSINSYEGILEQVGDNFIVINNNNQRIVFLISNIDHIEFMDTIKYKNVLE